MSYLNLIDHLIIDCIVIVSKSRLLMFGTNALQERQKLVVQINMQ